MDVSMKFVKRRFSTARRTGGACLAAAAIVTSLGVSGQQPGSSGAGEGGAPGTSSTADCQRRAADGVAAAKNAGATGSVTNSLYPSAVDASIAKGKTIWAIELNGGHASSSQSAQGMQKAAEAVGAKVSIFDGKGTPNLFVQGVNTAIAQHAAAIVLINVTPALVSGALADAKAEGIPVIYAAGGDPDEVNTDIFANSTTSAALAGKGLADYALAQTNCAAHVLAIYDPTVSTLKKLTLTAQAEVRRLCPTNCSFELVNSPNANPPGTTQILSGRLQVHPDTNFLISSSSQYVPYMQAALRSLEKNTPIVFWGGQSFPDALKGTTVQGGYIWAPFTIAGYYYFTAALDALHGVKNTTVVPSRLIDKSNWSEDVIPGLSDYTTQFKSLWGVK